jgi:hypothetical protein
MRCFALLAIACLVGSPAGAQTEKVHVVNFPEVQSIQGTVEMNEPAPGTRFAQIHENVVAPADPADAINLILAGTLDARGFRSAVLSVAGQIKSNYPGQGAVGALLVPDTPFFRTAFEEDGEALLSLRVEARVDSENGDYFAVSPPPHHLAFPSYKVYFFNTTERPASVSLYAYLAN